MNNANYIFPSEGAVGIEKVAEYLDISRAGVRRLIEKDETFPRPVKLLRSVKWSAKAVRKWFDENCHD